MSESLRVYEGTTKSISTLNVEGELPCLVIHSDKKHVGYIYNIINPLEEVLNQNGFRTIFLSDETLTDEHFGKTFEELAEGCVLGVVVFDGFRPNVLFEYGYLRGKDKPLILLQDKVACVAIKSYYRSCDMSGLTQRQYDLLTEPPIGNFDYLSDRAGIKVSQVDRNANLTSSYHPKNVVKNELKKIMPKIKEEEL